MSLSVLDVIFSVSGIGGNIRRFGLFRPALPASSPLLATLMRALVAVVTVLACLSLMVWLAVWLAMQLL